MAAAPAATPSTSTRSGPLASPRLRVGLGVAVLAAGSLVVAPREAEPLVRGLLVRLALAAAAATLLDVAVRAALASPRPPVRRAVVAAVAVLGPLALWYGAMTDPRVRAALVSVLAAVGISAALFVAANRWFDLVVGRWSRFAAVSGAVVVGVLALVLVGNRHLGLLVGPPDARRDLSLALVPVLAAAGAALGWGTARAATRRGRLVAGAVGGLAIGALAGAFLRPAAWPALRIVPLVVSPIVGAVVGLALATARRRSPWRGTVLGATLGWLTGTWLVPVSGRGTSVEAFAAAAVLGLGVGAWIGLGTAPDAAARIHLERRARVTIFVGPALAFIGATLLVPTLRTVALSLRDRRSANFVGLANYRTIFRDPNFIDIGGWAGIPGRGGFTAFAVLLVVALLLMLRGRRVTDGVWPPELALASVGAVAVLALTLLGRGQDPAPGRSLAVIVAVVAVAVLLVRYLVVNRGNSGLAGPGGAAMGAALFVLAFAVFASLRGTLFNNLWWVFTVTVASTGLGLAVAAIADRSRAESLAKSIIFMPMAISFVGAGIIWRFMFIARPPGDRQTGVLNAAWNGIGRLSTGPWRVPVALALLVAAAGLVALALRAWRADAGAVTGGSLVVAMPLVWLAARFLGSGVGGVRRLPDGTLEESILLFLQTLPYNNVWMMVPFTWIYTGFSMVIFSSAIKAVPADLLEAGRVDGGSESQLFWRVIVPEIAPTIGVVITTIIVVVTKVFDIVKVMTNGSFGTQVLANDMWARSFAQGDFGQGSAIAVMLFLSVLPVMYVNVRRMQKEAR